MSFSKEKDPPPPQTGVTEGDRSMAEETKTKVWSPASVTPNKEQRENVGLQNV